MCAPIKNSAIAADSPVALVPPTPPQKYVEVRISGPSPNLCPVTKEVTAEMNNYEISLPASSNVPRLYAIDRCRRERGARWCLSHCVARHSGHGDTGMEGILCAGKSGHTAYMRRRSLRRSALERPRRLSRPSSDELSLPSGRMIKLPPGLPPTRAHSRRRSRVHR